jgi:hypothetical protein
MRHVHLLPLTLVVLGCAPAPEQPEDELKTATSMTFSYRFHGAPYPPPAGRTDLHTFKVDPRQIKQLLALLVVDERSHLVPGDVPNSNLRFQLPGGITDVSFHGNPRQISLWHPEEPGARFWLLRLRDRRFYDKCVELAREHAEQ